MTAVTVGVRVVTPLEFGPPGWWKPTLVLLGLVLLAYLGMWWGWRRRGDKHQLPPLVEVPPGPRTPTVGEQATLDASARYFGTTVSGDWLDRVVARGLGARSQCRLVLSTGGLDVVRAAGSFRIPAAALRGARHDQGIAGKVVPPHGLLVVSWVHGELLLDSGFRLTQATTEAHDAWVRCISELVRKDAA